MSAKLRDVGWKLCVVVCTVFNGKIRIFLFEFIGMVDRPCRRTGSRELTTNLKKEGFLNKINPILVGKYLPTFQLFTVRK